MMALPSEFTARMEVFLGDEADAFFSSLEQERTHGLRVNPLKCDSSLVHHLPFSVSPVPWTRGGFYVAPEGFPGKHPLHHAGAYYIQEPCAMAPVNLLDVHPGDRVCDLCAAPGGKATQIAGNLNGSGLLLANEVIPSRAKVLSQNVERLGVTNCVVCSETPQRMADLFPQWFDKVLVDAPCSGEGMFRKEENSIKEWSVDGIAHCVKRQKEILNCADRLLAPGGVLVYSTCTFAPEEDEQMVAWFLQTHPDYTLEDWRAFLNDSFGIQGGSELSLSESSEKNAKSAFLNDFCGIEGGSELSLSESSEKNAHSAFLNDSFGIQGGSELSLSESSEKNAHSAFLNDFCGIEGGSELSLSESSEKNAHSAFLNDSFGIQGGRVEFLTKEQREFLGGDVAWMMRMFPHQIRGEGHFAARLKKTGETDGKVKHTRGGKTSPSAQISCTASGNSKRPRAGKTPSGDLRSFRAFCAQTLGCAQTLSDVDFHPHRVTEALQQANPRQFQFFGDTLYLVPPEMIPLDGIKVVRAGLTLGTQKKDRFEPAHALAMALTPAEALREVPCDFDTAISYLKGQPIPCDKSLSGWTLVSFQGVTLGWGKAKDGVLKNHYPKGLRSV